MRGKDRNAISRWALVAAVLISGSPVQSAAQAQQATAPSEIVFLAANHNLPFLHPGFSPAHIRALLSKIAPVALCLEILPEWPHSQGIPTFPQEQYAAMTWALSQGIPVYGVDWATPGVLALPPIVRMEDTSGIMERGDRFERFREDYGATVQWTAAQAFGETADDIESFQRRSLPLMVAQWPQEDSGASVRDDRIAENIRVVLAKYPGQRIALVFGSYHYLPLKRRLESTAGLRVVPPLRYLPLESDRLRAGWHPDDAVLLLGTNLDDWRTIGFPQSRDHRRTKELLDWLRRERPGSRITRYYEARWRMLFGDLKEARSLLREIAGGDSVTPVPYLADTRWSWPPLRTFEQRARFYLAVTHDLGGDHDAAAREYRTLLHLPEDQLVVSALIGARRVDLRPYIESLVRLPYRGGVFEAYRAFLAMGR